jgi:hypothetical protein
MDAGSIQLVNNSLNGEYFSAVCAGLSNND